MIEQIKKNKKPRNETVLLLLGLVFIEMELWIFLCFQYTKYFYHLYIFKLQTFSI